MTSTSQPFSSLYVNHTTCYIHTANGSLMNVSHQGSISMPNLTLPYTYLIPKLNYNPIFVGQLCDLGYELIFSSFGCRVQDLRMGQLIGARCKIGRLFEPTKLHVPPRPNLCAASTTPSIQLWHQRLAHSSLGKLCTLMSKGTLGNITDESFYGKVL